MMRPVAFLQSAGSFIVLYCVRDERFVYITVTRFPPCKWKSREEFKRINSKGFTQLPCFILGAEWAAASPDGIDSIRWWEKVHETPHDLQRTATKYSVHPHDTIAQMFNISCFHKLPWLLFGLWKMINIYCFSRFFYLFWNSTLCFSSLSLYTHLHSSSVAIWNRITPFWLCLLYIQHRHKSTIARVV